MRELGYETISGTPGTTAALTVAAVTSPAFPRLNAIAPVGSAIHYTIIASDGQVISNGVGVSTGAGAFTRKVEFSSFDGTTYTVGGSLASLPAGCTIFCGYNFSNVAPLQAPTWNGDANRWFEPGDMPVASTVYTPSATGRDHFWRFRNLNPHKIDAISVFTGAAGALDFGIYEVDWVTGGPAKLLLGWNIATTAVGANTLTLASATLGVLAGAASVLPTGDLYGMWNVSSTSVTSNRTIANVGPSGSVDADILTAKSILYATRTNATSFADSPTITGRHTTGVAGVPMVVFRGV